MSRTRKVVAAVFTAVASLVVGGGHAALAVDPTIPDYDPISPAAVGTAMTTQVALVILLSAFVFGALVFRFGFSAVWGALKSGLGIASRASKGK